MQKDSLKGRTLIIKKKPIELESFQATKDFTINTLEGVMKVKKGDVVIKGIEGEFYSCDYDIFKKTYDIIDTVEGVDKIQKELDIFDKRNQDKGKRKTSQNTETADESTVWRQGMKGLIGKDEFTREYTSAQMRLLERLAEIEREDEDRCSRCGGEDCVCCEYYIDRQQWKSPQELFEDDYDPLDWYRD